ncbi:hypothetical protein ACHHYP_08834 [Achlya hypogyna]|uniref:Transmembrane protein n=1 Tax=Achlya hypogyna TaxID=1202772 RepID=A0A1V9YP98_ACHHY|nr:hypothetical protein ACHHYP_08834 [Achlya hypogyna]
MATTVYCTSGTVVVGSYTRVLMLAAVATTVPLIVTVLSPRIRGSSPGLLYSSACLAGMPASYATDCVPINAIARAMCGLVSITWRGRRYVFDTMLWRRVPQNDVAATPVLPFAMVATAAPRVSALRLLVMPSRGQWRRVWLAVGATYVAFWLLGNVAYLSLIQANLDNDYYWAGFNSTGMHAYLANPFSHELLWSSDDFSIVLDSPAYGDDHQLYNGSDTSIIWGATDARRYLFKTPQSLLMAVVSLRTLDPCYLPWVATQYCWLDFNRIWEMANSRRRQERCADVTANGAVYLEAPLRNVNDWGAWKSCWGSIFEVGIALHLTQSAAGAKWLASVPAATSLLDEIAYWKAMGLTKFVTQWQNFKTVAYANTFSVTNVLGVTYALTLANTAGSLHPTQQTSMRIYWTLASDLWAVGGNASIVAGMSLVRGSGNYALVNTSSKSLLFYNLTLAKPLRNGLESYRATVGPFNSVDLVYVSAPPVVSAYYRHLTEALTTLLVSNHTAQSAYYELAIPSSIFPAPSVLVNDVSVAVVGGHVHCGNDNAAYPASVALYKYFGADALCYKNFAEQIWPTVHEMVVALASFKWSHGLNSADYGAICHLNDASTDACTATYINLASFLETFNQVFDEPEPAAQAVAALGAVNDVVIEVTQYVVYKSSSSSELFRMPLFPETDRPWAFYGWCYVYEWVLGSREVVSFRGDVGTVNVLSQYVATPNLTPDPAEVPRSLAAFCKYAVQYVTVVLIAVGAGVAANTIARGEGVEGLHLIYINRLVGLVWVGRSLLLLRSITALFLLNTSTLALVQVGHVTKLEEPPLPWYKTILAAAEVTWLVYVLNDVGSCVTLQYTSSYASKSSNLAWALAIAWTWVQPQRHQCTVERRCVNVNVDAGLICTGGNVTIGSTSRLQLAVGGVIACVIVCYTVERWREPKKAAVELSALCLSAQSIYLLHLDKWRHGNAYFLDTTSAIFAGVLAFEWHDTWLIFDIKTWRAYSRPTSKELLPPRFARAIPFEHI